MSGKRESGDMVMVFKELFKVFARASEERRPTFTQNVRRNSYRLERSELRRIKNR